MTPNAVKIVLARYMMRLKKSGQLSMWHADFLGGRGTHDYSMNYGSLEIRDIDTGNLTGTVFVVRTECSRLGRTVPPPYCHYELWDGQKSSWRAINIDPPDILEWIHQSTGHDMYGEAYFSYSWIGVA